MQEDPQHPGSLRAIEQSELSVLQAIVEGTVTATGDQFFRALVSNLSMATGVSGAFVAVFAETRTKVRALAFWMDGQFLDNQEWELEDTPCQEVLQGGLCHYPANVWQQFPKEEGVESYLGVPLKTVEGDVLGHLAIFDCHVMPAQPQLLYTFKIFAARAAAELGRLQMLEQLRHSEEQYRDLFNEAPIAYVHEDLESRFISANRTAMRILGITPEQVPGLVGMSLVPDTLDAQYRVQEAFESLGNGTDTSGIVLELRRKDNGKPIWIQWWSRPDPSGEFTRTMFIDITDKVLMEQEQARLQAQNQYLKEEIKSVHNFEDIVGRSPAIQSLLNNVRRVADTDASVLIQGESGTGKELIARAIHSASNRSKNPLIKVNCAALPASLIESELFGHEKGAFTGAISKRIGRFELADGGTLFLDEIGEIPLDVQVKLLRVLQEREFERVGGQSPITVDVRIIAATNRNLLQEVTEKNFREDLYYRLNVFPLTTPPLRDRIDDVPLLISFLIDKYAMKIGKKISGISEQSMHWLQAYRWPGNIRELENVIERAIILADGPVLEIAADLMSGRSGSPLNPIRQLETASDASFETISRQHIISVLEKTRWIIEGANGAAQILSLQPSTLRYRMKKLGITKPNR
ncbi:MAG: sigma 54-interacting transcriptional regulator [Methylococcaceae bacterium]|nr:sigma 54-interacting transcriptional regulator [Methylococcaceae bacterium]